MAELASRSVRKMTHADWLPTRAISFLCRAASLGGTFPSRFEDKQTRRRETRSNNKETLVYFIIYINIYIYKSNINET